MAKIISLCNQKGGVGKTTTAVNLSGCLAAKGRRVLIVDFDPQGNAGSGVGINTNNLKQHIYHAVMGSHKPSDLIWKAREAGYDVLPAAPDLAGANIELVFEKEREFKLKNMLSQLRTQYDYIIIDCPPSLGLLTINALSASEEIIIPVQCEYYALEGLNQLLKTINFIKKQGLNKDIKIMGALLTMYNWRSRLNRAAAKEVRRSFPGNVFKTVIPRSSALAEAPSRGCPAIYYNSWSFGTRAYQKLADEVIKMSVKNRWE